MTRIAPGNIEGKMMECDEEDRFGRSSHRMISSVLFHSYCERHSALMCIFALTLAITSCALFLTQESRYLRTAKNQATEVDVKQHLGDPAEITSDEQGKTVWRYQTRKQIQQGTNVSYITYPAWQCDRYLLTFDNHQILRDWTHTSREC